MTSSRLLAAAAFVGATGFVAATAASAATLQNIPGGNYSEMLHNDHQPSSHDVAQKSDPSGLFVDLQSPDVLTPVGNGNGFSQVLGPFTSLDIVPDAALSPTLQGFTKIGFTLDIPNKFDGTNFNFNNATFDITVTFLGGGTQTFSNVTPPSFSKYDIWAQGSEIITDVNVSDLSGDYTTTGPNKQTFHVTDQPFDDIKQISFNAAAGTVPEPATWAMMLLGFFGAGALLRRRARAMSA